ncbi:grasp-with-spasm system ATP-grasp peptide maturase [Pedobacter agri]|uniref:grasp-with-spasm system ATP-grasp peptide maturase n=1 Tax=Pedobacter agri TaxID=454586 RepID=UPI00292F3875|nr:grasp-with-spasm system ATP-grasp peptide maturase [Pedobacter agri]
MILILSRSDDGSTSKIIDWLFYQRKTFIRLNGNKSHYDILRINDNEIMISINGHELNILMVESVWYRRNGFGQSSFRYNLTKSELKTVFKKETDQFYVYNQIKDEFKVLFEYLYYLIETNVPKALGSYYKKDINKLITLNQAKNVGLKVPQSFIVSERSNLGGHFGLITKALKDGVYYRGKEYDYYSYTEKISDTHDDLPIKFLPSLVQIEIKKKYELRIFFLKGEVFSTVIFSQQNKNATTDFRKEGHSVRYLPFALPFEIKEKITLLMANLGHDIGAVDMIVDQEDNYIFLEINPGGQFSYYSDMCNYNLEKKIAELL